MSENFWEQRKLEIEQTRQAELEKKAAEQKEKKKSQVVEKTEKKKEKQPKKVEQQKEQTQQQPNGAAAASEQKEKKKKNFKKNKEASQPSTSQPATTEASAQDDFQTVERKTGGRRQFRGANKRSNNKKKENGEKKKENKENKEQQPKKEEKTTTEQGQQQVVVQPVQIKVFSTTESTPVQGSDSWVSLLRGNQPESTSTTQQQQPTSNGAATSTKKSKPKSEKKTVVAKPVTAEKTTTEAKNKPQKNYESGKNLLRSTEVEVDQALLDEVGVFIQPRGMTNINNSCYMNAVLQTLVSLPQFYHVMKRLGKISLDNEEYPLTNKFVRLVNEYQTMKTHRPQSGKEGEKKDRKYFINASTEHLVPSYIVDYIQQSSTNLEDAFLLGTQHDAHEFLNHILQRLHEELKKTEATLGRKSPSASKKKSNKKQEATSEQAEQPSTETTSEEWKEVGKKNKANPMREHEMGDSSVIARTFAGKMKSFVQKQGESKGSSVVEPFFSLHLPIKDENIKGVKFALREMTKEENVSDKNAKSSIYQLPKVLLLHLRRFDFSSTEGVQKISKRIRFDYELNIDEKVVPNVKAISGRPSLKYRLASVICHHGKDATSGHYSTYIQHGCGKWIHIDDTKVTVVSLQHVLDQQAYILTYVQDDNQEHYKLYSEGSSSSPLFSESSEQNGEKKKDHKKKDKKDKKEKKSKPATTTTTTTTTPTTTETKTEAKTDV
ncbi:ubiquitin carboxyl-terminal peptidase [Naegleria gruberi]|uniref:ubiquitinyl hydrolase 1 n=1 Tax=Naegleria gruberi TaxID=5762 RepID=D2VJA6_NAEGR|nr:ubiquitin carboxyl-terminal peptidase [Naegleria gruberi]EFC43162.1 ubiquitin carboxyl-terminal peptidase [Naegleria gruberi]|eukprot:XP_002675906.1 ubiquitin carboxyl-terminal peptidase [Naegleria gruberi strain NEG-M]